MPNQRHQQPALTGSAKPILVRPDSDLRKEIEASAVNEERSMGKQVLILCREALAARKHKSESR